MTTDPIEPLEHFAAVRRDLEARWPETQISPTLSRIRTLTQYLGDPQRAFPVIHVTGTNGKTSTARMIESLLRSFGLHTGLITSPHLADLRERIRLQGEPIELNDFLRVYAEVAPVLAMADQVSELGGGPRLSFFEVMVGLGFAAFADAPVDVAVVEVGMGGTWDATNVADAQVAVIMPIGMDHSDYLGDTLADIAGEKAGIIKPTSLVVLAAQESPAQQVITAAALQLEAATAMEGVHYGVIERVLAVGGQQMTLRGLGGDYTDIFLPLFGEHQARNAAAALVAVESFFGLEPPELADPMGEDPARISAFTGLAEPSPSAPNHSAPNHSAPNHSAPNHRAAKPVDLRDSESTGGIAADVPVAAPRRQLDPVMVRAGFASVTSPGRLEVVRRSPTVLVDAAHNVPGVRAMVAAVAESFGFTATVAVVGILAGKDAGGMLAALEPLVDKIVITRSSSPRAIPVAELAAIAADLFGEERVETVDRLDEALERGIGLAEQAAPAGVGAGVLVTGSVTMAAEARMLLGAESGSESGATRSDHAAPRGRGPDDLEDLLDDYEDYR